MLPDIFHFPAEKLRAAIIVLLFGIGMWQLTSAYWIQAKAFIAQQLLVYSWNETIQSGEHNAPDSDLIKSEIDMPQTHKPWPWADTWPVAKLLVPQYNIEQIVLAGDSGSSLAFGPGYSLASAKPDTPGTTVISGHRDTHFSFLKKLKKNDIIKIQTVDNNVSYRVYDIKIVDSHSFKIENQNDRKTLVLVTCYPFEAIDSGGSLRYLVYARQQESNSNSLSMQLSLNTR